MGFISEFDYGVLEDEGRNINWLMIRFIQGRSVS